MTTKIDFFDLKSSKKLIKSTFLGSVTIRIKSAFSALSNANFIPFFSISSFASLIPAVSDITTGKPSKFKCASITSLVVPAISETIATSLFDK